MRAPDLHRLRRIVDVRAVQKSGDEASLGRARQACEERREGVADATNVLARDHAAWLTKMSGETLDLGASAVWARVVCEAGAGLAAADEALVTAQDHQMAAQARLTRAIGRHEAACATLNQSERQTRRRRDERALEVAEDMARARGRLS